MRDAETAAAPQQLSFSRVETMGWTNQNGTAGTSNRYRYRHLLSHSQVRQSSAQTASANFEDIEGEKKVIIVKCTTINTCLVHLVLLSHSHVVALVPQLGLVLSRHRNFHLT